jgi:hypothetical protein
MSAMLRNRTQSHSIGICSDGPGPDIQTSGDTDDLSKDYVTINGDGLIKPQVVRD